MDIIEPYSLQVRNPSMRRLRNIKSKYDPDDVYTFGQSM